MPLRCLNVTSHQNTLLLQFLTTLIHIDCMCACLTCAGGVYIAGGITPKLLPRLRGSTTGGGALLEGYLNRNVRQKFRDILADIPVSVITNEKVRSLLGSI